MLGNFENLFIPVLLPLSPTSQLALLIPASGVEVLFTSAEVTATVDMLCAKDGAVMTIGSK